MARWAYSVMMAGEVTNASVLKACKVLRAFTPTVGVLSVRQVAARAQIPRSTAHELCRTLVSEGMLETSGSRLPTRSSRSWNSPVRSFSAPGLLRAAEGILDRLVRAPEQEAHLGQLLQGWVVYLDRNSSTRHVSMLNRVGQRAPAHLTGCGKAALSWLPFDKVVTHVEKCCAENGVRLPNLKELER